MPETLTKQPKQITTTLGSQFPQRLWRASNGKRQGSGPQFSVLNEPTQYVRRYPPPEVRPISVARPLPISTPPRQSVPQSPRPPVPRANQSTHVTTPQHPGMEEEALGAAEDDVDTIRRHGLRGNDAIDMGWMSM